MAQQLGSFEKVLRVGEGRRLKRLAQQAAYIGTLEDEFEKLSDEELAAKTVEFQQRFENGETLDELLFEAFAAVREAFKRTMDVRLFDVQLMGGIVLHEGDIAEMKTGEGKTFVADAGAVPQRDRRQRRAPRHDERLPRAARPRVDAPRLRGARDAHRVHREHDAVRAAARGVPGRRHVRDELRVRLRLSPRQHGGLARGDRPARPPLRDRGRGRLDPHRRGAHAADHLRRAGDAPHSSTTTSRASRPQLVAHESHPGDPKGAAEEAGADYEYDEKHKTVAVTEQGVEKVERALRIENLYAPQNAQLVNHLVQALKAQSLYQRRRSTT